MAELKHIIPNFVLERSLGFKTLIIILGASLLLLSSLMRSTYPLWWIPVFVFGAVLEWLIVATVYVEIDGLESDIEVTSREIQEMVREVEEVQDQVEETQDAINQTKEDVFSFASSSEGLGDSIEERIEKLERKTGIDGFGRDDLDSRLSELESELDSFDRGGRF